MYFLHVLLQLVLTSERLVNSAVATGSTAREAALKVLRHVPLHLEVAIEQCWGEADAAL
jgi:hypothetical protein